MIDLVEAGRRLATWDAGEPTDLAALYSRARRRRTRRRVAAGVSAVVAAAAVAATVLVVPGGAQSRVRVGPATRAELPAVVLPPAPAGWSRTAAGAVDLAIPPSSNFETTGVGRRSYMEVCLTRICYSTATPSAAYPVVVVPVTGRSRGTPRVIDGLRVLVSGSARRRAFEVPTLGVRLETFGTLGQRIAATMVPSPALVVASATSAPAVAAGWRSVHYDGVSVSVPTTWPVVHLRRLPVQPPAPGQPHSTACELFVHAQLDVGNPPGRCGPGQASSSPPPPALWLGQSEVNSSGLTETRLPWIVGAHVELGWARYGPSYLANLTIRTASGVIHGTIGFGPDPALIEAILASIRVGP